MKTTASTTTETTMSKRKRGGKIVRAWRHVCTLECGHVEERTWGGYGGAWLAPENLKCRVCGK